MTPPLPERLRELAEVRTVIVQPKYKGKPIWKGIIYLTPETGSGR